jgi:thioredoxin-like negative regulator of GroEL
MDNVLAVVVIGVILYWFLFLKDTIHVYYFYGPKCSNCATMNPIFNEVVYTISNDMMKSGKYSFYKLNIEEPKNMALSESIGIKSIPTIVKVGSDNKIVKKEGAVPYEDVMEWLGYELV